MKTPREIALELCQAIDHDWQETDGGYYCVICHEFIPYECGFEDDLEGIPQKPLLEKTAERSNQ